MNPDYRIAPVAAGTTPWNLDRLLEVALQAVETGNLATIIGLAEVDLSPRVLNASFGKRYGSNLINTILNPYSPSRSSQKATSVERLSGQPQITFEKRMAMAIYLLDHGVYDLEILAACNIAHQGLWERIIKIDLTGDHQTIAGYQGLETAVGHKNLIAVQQLCSPACKWGRTTNDGLLQIAMNRAIEIKDKNLGHAMFKLIIENVPNVHSANGLNLAVAAGWIDLVQMMLRQTTAYVNKPYNSYGQLKGYPLWNAVLGGHYEITQLLLATGANPELATEGYYIRHGTLRDIYPKVANCQSQGVHRFDQATWDLVLTS